MPTRPRCANLNGDAEQLARLACGSGLPARRDSGCAVLLGEFRLGVEQVHLARPAVLEQADDGLGLRGVVRRARRERVGGRLPRRALLREQVGQRQRAEAAGVRGRGRPGGSVAKSVICGHGDVLIRRTGTRCSPGPSGTGRSRRVRRRPSPSRRPVAAREELSRTRPRFVVARRAAAREPKRQRQSRGRSSPLPCVRRWRTPCARCASELANSAGRATAAAPSRVTACRSCRRWTGRRTAAGT